MKALHSEGVAAATIIGKVLGKGFGLVHIRTSGHRQIPSLLALPPVGRVTPTAGIGAKESTPSIEPEGQEVPCCADAVSSAKTDTGESSEIYPLGIDKIKAKFTDFLSSASAPHGLDAYTKQAMAIALSVAMRCEPCLKMYLKKAKKKASHRPRLMRLPGWESASAAHPPWPFTSKIRTRRVAARPTISLLQNKIRASFCYKESA